TQDIGFEWPEPVYDQTNVFSVDFNHDGVRDEAYVSPYDNLVAVRLHSSNGSFQDSFYAAGPNIGSLASGDFDGERWPDLVVVNSLSTNKPTLTVLLNDGMW